MLDILLLILIIFVAIAIYFFIKDIIKHKNQLEQNSWGKTILIGFIADFLDALGIGCFAPATALLKFFKQTKDCEIPGVLNISYLIPTLFEAFIFLKIIKVDLITLITMIVASVIGAWFGAGIVSKLSEKKIQIFMGIALLITAFFIFAGKMHWLPSGGTAIGLTHFKLIIGLIGNFIFGALSAVGIGLFAPCMALVYILGMSSQVAFPIMMGSCAFLTPAAAIKFIQAKAYNRKAAIGMMIGGSAGVIIAAYIIKSLPLSILQWLVMAIISYTGIIMLRTGTGITRIKGLAGLSPESQKN
jgi:uncharacterized membrane protein YfcA